MNFDVVPADVDETPLPGESPVEYVVRVARDKARAVAGPDRIVLAADTTVDVDGTILAKPVDGADARRMLRLISGRQHLVHTGVAVIESSVTRSIVVTTEVQLVELSPEAIDWYVATGEPSDKAGAYAIQGGAAGFVESITGSVTNVVGLPLAQTLSLLTITATATATSPPDPTS